MNTGKHCRDIDLKTTNPAANKQTGLSDRSPATGTLYGLGVGPGDPELITVKALNCLRSAPVIAFPAGLNGQPGVAERSIASWISADQQCVALNFPYVQDPNQLVAAWTQAAKTIHPYLQKGDVAFACEGDISFYSTFTYLAQYLRVLDAEVKVEAIAGISSPMAAAAALGIPLTCQAEKLAILPALYTVNQLDQILDWAEVIVLMKVGSVYHQVWEILAQRQLLKQSYVVENATKRSQKTYRGLVHHPDLKLPYFSIMIVKNTLR
ncbi:MAG: precorrin-2 C(20)-methyltransferase [Cyanobacteria bacterium J06650_10]